MVEENMDVERNDEANPENPIGPDTSSQASTQSVGSSDDFDDPAEDTEEMTLPRMVREFNRLEEELFEISSIIQFMSAKIATMKNILQKFIADE